MGIRRWCSLAGTAALVVVIAGCGSEASIKPLAKLAPLPGEASSSPCGQPRADSQASNATLTKELVNRLLQTFPALPGAASVSSAPLAALKQAPMTGISSNLVTATGWWKAPGSERAAQHYVTTHLPSQWQAPGTISGPTAALFFSRRDTAFAAGIKVVAAFGPLQGGVGERVDVQAIYWPRCPDIDALIGDPTSAEVTIERPDAAAVRRTLDRAGALKLIAVLKALPPPFPALTNCPLDLVGDVDIVSFRTATRVITVRDDMTGCRELTFVGHPNIALSDLGGLFDRAVLAGLKK